MKVKDLPKRIRKLVKKRFKENKSDTKRLKTVKSAIFWITTPEGLQFWSSIDAGDFQPFYDLYGTDKEYKEKKRVKKAKTEAQRESGYKHIDIDLSEIPELPAQVEIVDKGNGYCTSISNTLAAVIQRLVERENAGIEKYGKSMDRDDLSTLDWIEHAQEEAMDMILYFERIKQKLRDKAVL